MTTRQVFGVMTVCTVGLIAIEIAIVQEVHGGWWHRVAGLDLLAGFTGCLALIWGAKALGRLGLQRSEHEYPETEP
tara:strand:+ start:843 stop:1070 length:228 start_codon:yes stop_codon:yes gene_type:complete